MNLNKKTCKNVVKTWKIIREVTKKSKFKHSNISSVKCCGVETSDPLEIANIFNSHFTSAAVKIADKIPPTNRSPEEHFKSFDSVFYSAFNPVTPLEVFKTTKQLQDKKSCDMNGISSFLIKKMYCLVLWNQSLMYSIFRLVLVLYLNN